MSEKTCHVRAATPADTTEIHAMICELAEFEKMTADVVSTPTSIWSSLFGEAPAAEAIVAESDSDLIGFAVFFHNYSTFIGRPGLYLEDVYVRPIHRRSGVGNALLKRLAQIALERNCGRFEWSVLDWNVNAIEFYEGLGANVMHDWRIVRLNEEGIARLAES